MGKITELDIGKVVTYRHQLFKTWTETPPEDIEREPPQRTTAFEATVALYRLNEPMAWAEPALRPILPGQIVNRTRWTTRPCRETTGIIVGMRWLRDVDWVSRAPGDRAYAGTRMPSGIRLVVRRSFPAILVAKRITHKPVLVLLEDLI